MQALSCVIRPLGAAPAPTQCAPTRPVQIDELAASLHGFVGADVTSLCTHAFLAAVCLPPSTRARAPTRTRTHEHTRKRAQAQANAHTRARANEHARMRSGRSTASDSDC